MARYLELNDVRENYAASIDPDQLDREPIILQQNGKPIGVVISAEQYQAFVEWKKNLEQSVDFPPEWRAEKAAFEQMLPDLLSTHRGKWVAVYKSQVVDSDAKIGELVWRAEKNLGDKPFFVGEVVEEPRVHHIPSVWFKQP
jgi:hypothetical protein